MTDEPFPATITASRLLTGMSRNASAKWLFVAAVGALNMVWMKAAGFHFGEGFLTGAVAAAALAAIALLYFYNQRDERIRDYAHFAAQFVALSLVMIPLECLGVSTHAPLADRSFVALDEAMGLDWVAWARWVGAYPLVHATLAVAYNAIWPQTILTFAYNVHTRASERNSELWWVTAFASLVTVPIAAILPASNPWIYHGLAAVDDFRHAQQFLALRAGDMHVLSLPSTRCWLSCWRITFDITAGYSPLHLSSIVLLFSPVRPKAAIISSTCPPAQSSRRWQSRRCALGSGV